MKSKRSILPRIFILAIVLVVLAASPGLPAAARPGMSAVLGVPLAQPSLAGEVDPWLSMEQAAPQTPGNPYVPAAPAAEIQGHLGYDKATGQFLPDPTIVQATVSSPEDLALLEQIRQEKLQAVDSTQIRFRSGYTIHPQPGIAPEVSDRLNQPTEAPIGDGYYVVQFSYPYPTQARRDLEAAGVTFYDDLDVAAGLAKIPSEVLDDLQVLVQDGLVQYVGAIPAQARLSPDLAGRAALDPDGSSEVVLLTFDQPTQAQLDELSRWLTVERRSDGPVHILEGAAANTGLQSLAGLEYVRWIEPQIEAGVHNLEGGMAMGADIIRGASFDGELINVSVIDTGIARSGTTYHPDLLAGRILDQWDFYNNDSNAADDHSHGTHVAGSIGGKSNVGDINSIQPFQGVAPEVNFYIYKLANASGSGFFNAWFQDALTRGNSSGRVTHVSNNSWGGGNGIYNTASEIADRAVRGEYGNDVNMVISSGNDNNLTSAPGSAKNAITVGAVKDGNFPADEDISNAACAGPDYDWPPAGRVCYSNYGPLDTDGNGSTRKKPDIMAAGEVIYSPVPWYLYGDSRYYSNKGGTSMAAPHVTGAVAQFLDQFPGLLAWPEVVRAFFLATAINVGDDVNQYGRGLLDAYHANYYQPGIQNQSHWWGNSLSESGDSLLYTFTVDAGYEEVIVVLTWPDPPGATEAINDLDISFVNDGGGETRGSSVSWDDNVEYVRIPAGGTPGTWTIRVYAYSLSSAQSFGLAANPILAPADLSIDGTVEYFGSPGFAVDPGATFYYHQYVSNSGYAAGGTYARLFVPTGFTVEGVRIYTDDGASHFYGDAEIYHPGGSYWRIALGTTIAGNTRHVRWFILADPGTACGAHSFQNQPYFTDAGALTAGPSNLDTVNVTCDLNLPLTVR